MVKVTRANSAPDLNQVREELERKQLEAEKQVLELEKQETQSAPSSPSHDDLVQQLSTGAQEFEELAKKIESERTSEKASPKKPSEEQMASTPASKTTSSKTFTEEQLRSSHQTKFEPVVEQLNQRFGIEKPVKNEKTSNHGFFSFLPSASAFLSMTVDILKTLAMAAVILAAGALMGAATAMYLGGSVAVGAGIGAATGAAGLGCAHLVDSGFSFFGSSKSEQPDTNNEFDMEPQLGR